MRGNQSLRSQKLRIIERQAAIKKRELHEKKHGEKLAVKHAADQEEPKAVEKGFAEIESSTVKHESEPTTTIRDAALPNFTFSNKNKVWVQYGLQRTATNWVSALLQRNFGISLRNNGDRNSILHKHTRQFFSMTFDEFNRKVAVDLKIDLNREQPIYVVCVKHPYSWYLSFREWSLKCKSSHYNRTGNNPEYMDLYNQFYGKWIEFQQHHPDQVFFFRYESLLRSLRSELDQFSITFNLRSKHTPYKGVQSVSQSKSFTSTRETYYLQKNWKDKLSASEREMLIEKTDIMVPALFNYDILNRNVEWTVPEPTN